MFREKEIISLAKIFEEKIFGVSTPRACMFGMRTDDTYLFTAGVEEIAGETKKNIVKKLKIATSSIKVFCRGLFFLSMFSVSAQASSPECATCERASCQYSACPQKTPAAWYDLGVQAYKNGDYAQACCLWQRACAVGGSASVREKCAYNCSCAYKKLELEEPTLSWWERLGEECARVPLLFLQILFLLALYGALLFVYKGRRQRTTRRLSAVFFISSVVLSGLLLLNKYASDARAFGVVVQDQQLLYAGPGSDYPERGFLACGQTVKLCSLRGEWYKVRSSACEIGWMPRAALMSVKP